MRQRWNGTLITSLHQPVSMCHSWTFQNTYCLGAISARTPRWLSNETWRHVVWKSTWIVWVRKCSAAYWLPFVGGSVQYGQRGGRPTVARDATSVLVTHRAFLNADPAEVKFLHKPGLSEVGKIPPTSNKPKKELKIKMFHKPPVHTQRGRPLGPHHHTLYRVQWVQCERTL